MEDIEEADILPPLIEVAPPLALEVIPLPPPLDVAVED
jgi:hypothetical protein